MQPSFQIIIIIIIIYLLYQALTGTIETFSSTEWNHRLTELNKQISNTDINDTSLPDLTLERDQIKSGLQQINRSALQPSMLWLISHNTLKNIVADTEQKYWNKHNALAGKSDITILADKIVLDYEKGILIREQLRINDKKAVDDAKLQAI